MGWANCGEDSKGRPIGYAHEATCDHSECEAKIDRGLAYACGQMHGESDGYCEGYFCPKHRQGSIPDGQGRELPVCDACEKIWREENPAEAAVRDEE